MKKDTVLLLAAVAGVLYLAKRKKDKAAAATTSSAAASPLTATAQETPVARPALAPSQEAEEAEAEESYIDDAGYAVIDTIPAYTWGVTNWGGWRGGRRHRHRGGGGRGGRGR